jgi:hypothetical protein
VRPGLYPTWHRPAAAAALFVLCVVAAWTRHPWAAAAIVVAIVAAARPRR